MAKQKGIKDKSETSEKVITSNSGSWIADLQAKKDAETAPVVTDQKQSEVVVKHPKKAPKYRQSHHTGHSCLRGSVCITRDGGATATRVSRKTADALVSAGQAKFAPRSLWKNTVRGTASEVVAVTEVKAVKVKKDKKAKKKT